MPATPTRTKRTNVCRLASGFLRTLVSAAITLAALGAAAPLAAQQAPTTAPPAAPAARAGRPPATKPLDDGPWDFATEQARIHVTVVTKNLDHPWGLAFLPDGGMLVTERPGRLRVIRGGVLDPKPLEGLPPIRAAVIGGLSDVVLHPQFARNRLVYFSYSKPDKTEPSNTTLAVARARWDGGAALANVEDVFVAPDWYGPETAGKNHRCCGQGPADGSFGARMVFGRDGLLYVTSGDRNWGERSQEPSSDFGKIIRIRDDGSIPKNQPVRRQGRLQTGDLHTRPPQSDRSDGAPRDRRDLVDGVRAARRRRAEPHRSRQELRLDPRDTRPALQRRSRS